VIALRQQSNAPEDVGTGNVARFARSAREIVSLVACAAARSRSTLPVATDWFVTRNVRTSDTDWAAAGIAEAIRQQVARMARDIILLFQLDAGREQALIRLNGARDGDIGAIT